MDGDRPGGTRINYVTSQRTIPPIPPTTNLPYKKTKERFPAEVTLLQFKELLFVNQGTTNGN